MKRVLIGLAALAVCAAAASAYAQDYGLGYGMYPYPYAYNTVVPDKIPYFAQNPPVYYSDVIIPRPYGWSPFPFPPMYSGPQMAPPAPAAPSTPSSPAIFNDARPRQAVLHYSFVR